MQLTIDSGESKENLRLAASFLLHLVGDIVEEPTAAEHTHPSAAPGIPTPPADPNSVFPPVAPVPPAPTAAVPPPPPPPPPAPIAAAAPGAVSASEAPPHTFPTFGATANTNATANAAVAPPAPAPGTVTTISHSDVDSAGLPWDARIHQKKKSKKQDGTWKLLKGIDMTLVASVVSELTANKLPASVSPGTQLDIVMPQQGTVPSPPASSTVPVPPAPVGPATGTVPVPPPPAASAVPAPPVPPSVPAAAAPAVGALPAASGYRELIQKCSAATKSGKLDPVKLQSIVQARGAPNVQGLRDMPHLIADVDADIEALLLGVG